MLRGVGTLVGVCAAAGLILSVWGCESLSDYFGATPEETTAAHASPSPPPTVIATPEPTPEPSTEAPRHKHHARAVGEPQGSPTESPDTTAPSPSGTAPTVTLDNDQAARQRAQGLLDSANSKLGRVDRSRLTGDDAATYAQATTFAGQAQQAIGEHDYVAATGLAEKASLLADKVATATATPAQTGY